MENPKKLFLLDAYALIYRAYYAFIKSPRMNSKGQNTSAIFGFVNTLEDLIKRENPSHIAVGFDPAGPTFRHEAYEKYKAQREETPEVIRRSVPYIKKIIEGYHIPILEVPGFEADDVIGTIAWKAEKAGFTVYMMTPDKDYGQLVTENVFMYKPKYGSNDCEVLGPEEIKKKYSLTDTKQMIDFLGLMGDSSDNIPGCPGVGEVTAKNLIAEFGSIENLLQNTGKIKGKLKDKIIENKDQILFSQFLATIRTDVPIEFEESKLVRETIDENALRNIFEELEFRNMLNRIMSSPAAISPEKNSEQPKSKKQKDTHGQISLWDIFEDSTEKKPDLSKEKISSPENESPNKLENGIFQTDGQDKKFHSILKSLRTEPHSYYLLDTESKIKDFVASISVQDFFCFDTETTGLDAMTAELVGMSFSWEKNVAYYIPFPPDQKSCKEKLQLLKNILEKSFVLKIGQNLKYDIVVLKKYDINVCGPIFDTMVAHYLLQPELRHNMDYLAEIYLNYQTVHIDELIGSKGKNQKSMRDISPEIVCPYAAEDADITLQLKNILEPEIQKNNLSFLCYEVEMPLVLVLAEMETTGVGIDRESLKQASITMTKTLNNLEKEIQDIAGMPFNVNSPKQIGEILFDKLEIGGKAKKTKTGQYSTSEDVLESLKSKHPIVEKILEQRGIKKLLSTYIDALPLLINPQTRKIHTSFNQTVTATGRLSSSNPNLQNIPVREAMGREIRKTFAAGPGEIFFSADYSQIELRLMAHLSQDSSMIEAFRNGQDIHAATAAKIYKIPLEDVTSDMRRKAKTANFGIIYGISVFGLAERMAVSRNEAKELIDGYFETYPGVKAYMDKSILDAKENGWVETIYHRKRYLPDINSHNANVRGYAERNAINAPIQGTAADIIKLAMVRIQKAIEEKNLKTRMILQVHDELNFIVPKGELVQVQKMVSKEMEMAANLEVPLKADTGYGKNWLEAHS
jgi:DNA polymerase I